MTPSTPATRRYALCSAATVMNLKTLLLISSITLSACATDQVASEPDVLDDGKGDVYGVPGPSPTLHVFASANVLPQGGGTFLGALPAVVAGSRNEDGNLRYLPMRGGETFAFLEAWEDEGALANHFTLPHVGAFVQQVGSILAGPPVTEKLEALTAPDWRMTGALHTRGIVIVNHVEVKTARAETRLRSLLRAQIAHLRADYGVRAADAFKSLDAPRTYVVAVVFRDQSALQDHAQSESVAAFGREIGPSLAKPIVTQVFEPIAP